MDKPNSSTQEAVPIRQNLSPRDKFFLRAKRRFLRHIWLARLGLVVAVVASVYLAIVVIGFALTRIGIPNYVHLVSDFIFTPAAQIHSQEGRTNFLILGKAGAGHDAPDLTDTIIFASVSQGKPSTVLVSLPRDIWVPAIRAKLNSAYYWGKQRAEAGGLVLAKSEVEAIVGQPVHYGIVIDFSAFKQIIDVIGGIDVDVDRAFVDNKYPIVGRENDECGGDREFKCRYQTVSFSAGTQKMDGETALKFVRSRNAEGEEGTDIARAARQQKIIVALKNKILSPAVIFSPKKLLGVWKEVKDSVESDIDPSAAAILARRILASRNEVRQLVLSEEFLANPQVSPRYDNQYVFLPKEGNWSKVHEWINCLLNSNCLSGK